MNPSGSNLELKYKSIIMKITKNQLKEIIREELKSFKKEINETQSINEGLWSGLAKYKIKP
jgi:hypothetical protein